MACGVVTRAGPCPVHFIVWQLTLKAFLKLLIADLELRELGQALACHLPGTAGYCQFLIVALML